MFLVYAVWMYDVYENISCLLKKKNLMPSGDTSYGPNSDKWHGAASM